MKLAREVREREIRGFEAFEPAATIRCAFAEQPDRVLRVVEGRSELVEIKLPRLQLGSSPVDTPALRRH